MEKYRQLKILGKGSFGAAWLIQRKSDNEQLVAKEVRLAGLKPQESESAKHEIIMLRTLKHPNITKYEDHFEHHGSLFIVMEYANGGDMYMKIKERRGRLFSEQEVLHYFSQLCLALNYLHESRVLHRDLKTQNVFLTRDGIVKLGDFGISTVLRNTCELKRTVCGTPYYFSPELCLNKPYNNKSDVWALGCVLYEITTLNHAFDGTNMKALVQKILKGVYPPISAMYSPELSNLISKMLDVNPSRRPNVSQILQLPFLRGALMNLQEKLHVAQKQMIAVLPAIENNAPFKIVAKRPAEVRGHEPSNISRQGELHQQQQLRENEERKRQLIEKQRELQCVQEQALQERKQQLAERVRVQRRLQEQRVKSHEAKFQQLEERWDRQPLPRAPVYEKNRREEEELARPREETKDIYLEMRRQALLNKQRVQALEHGYGPPPGKPKPVGRPEGEPLGKPEGRPFSKETGPLGKPFSREPTAARSPRRGSLPERLEDARAAAFWQMRREAEQNRRRVLGLDGETPQSPVNYILGNANSDPYPNPPNTSEASSSRQRSNVSSPCAARRRKGGAEDGGRAPLHPPRREKVHSSPSIVPPCRDLAASPTKEASPVKNRASASPNAGSPLQNRSPPWLASPELTYLASSLANPANAEGGEGFHAFLNDETTAEDHAQTEKHRHKDYGDLDTVIANALIGDTTSVHQGVQDFDDDATMAGGDGANGRDLMRFMLEGKTLQLPHVRESDPLMCRIEALRVYLEDNLGENVLLACYNAMNRVGDDDNAMQRILEALPQEKQRYVPLVAQLIVCEDVFNRQGEVPPR